MAFYNQQGGTNYTVAGFIALLAGGVVAIVATTFTTSNLIITEQAAPALSDAGTTKVYADSTAHALKISNNGGAYAAIGTGTVTSVTGSTPIASSGGATPAISLNDAGVTYAKVQDVAALSIVGRSANTSGVSAAITASATGQTLRYSGTSIGFGALDLADTDAVTGDLPFANLAQGSGVSVLGVTAGSTADVASIAAGTDGHVLRRASSTSLAFSLPNGITTVSSTDYPIVAADDGKIINVTTGASDRTLTCNSVTAATFGAGFTFTIRKADSGSGFVIFDPTSTETINGTATTNTLKAQFAQETVMSDGSNWIVLNAYDYIKATQTATNYPGSGAYGNDTSIILPPGEWLIAAATTSTTNISTNTFGAGISTTTGNDATGLTTGDNFVSFPGSVINVTQSSCVVPEHRVIVTTATTYYLKVFSTYVSTTPQYVGRISAHRVN